MKSRVSRRVASPGAADSAGGGLTVALINRLRDAGENGPACDGSRRHGRMTISGVALATKDAVDPLIHKGFLEELAGAYLPGGMDRKRTPGFPALR